MASKADTNQKPKDITNPDVVTKFNAASEITQNALKFVIEKCTPEAKILDICVEGDKFITDAVSKIYTKNKTITKGIAFPTCISVNNIACHFSPLESDPESNTALAKGDLVKVQLGTHIDGYPAIVAHTFVIGATKEEPATGIKADTILAAHYSAEAALRTVVPGNKTSIVTDIVNKVCSEFGVKPVEGMLSYQVEQNVLEGEKQIILNPTEAHRKGFKINEIAQNEVYCVDIVVSSKDGKVKSTNNRTTVYRRTDSTYQLKMAASRKYLSEVNTKHGKFPFNIRSSEDIKAARMGVVECVRSQVLANYDVMAEEKDQFVAQYLFTVLLTGNGSVRLTTPGLLELDAYKSEKSIQSEEVLEVLKKEVERKPKEKKTSA
ncbi:proliferation-associated protein 1 [Conidiobolus coronatus NRRL 28638]|uniref:Proliferation-associated protein 1 n=1 Tax=Conidiobolus coronatus (strain ATCC 28846 / CBS 209.66 / NRRL 28638) TaxID=796925 RepID=A0A137P7F2_CONC2|nr:proliferation-associated protein 1 [Conidiobolus coronatus NRRL 28638]|eukprot:KXN70932.1 proliferation-associated protein 1 [Conidiobolus coronatus NRRL 28638]